MDELLAAGRQRIPVGARATAGLEPYGYQLLGVLLGHGTYDTHFLATVGADLVDFEYEHGTSAFWADARHFNARLNWIDGPGEVDPPAGFDPMIGLMKALIANPEAGRYLFTSTTPDEPIDPGLRRLDYLLTDREWPFDTVVAPYLTAGDVHTGLRLFGQALERITTVDADERAHRIVEGIIRAVGTDESVRGYPNDPSGRGEGLGRKTVPYPGTDVVHEVLRPYLGRIASHYIEDLHWRIEGNWGRSDWLSAGEMRLTGVDERHLAYFLTEVGKDPRARDEVFAAELAYADRLYRTIFDGWDGSDSDVVIYANGRVTRPLGILLGALDAGAQEMIARGYEQADEAHNRAVTQRLFWLRAPTTVISDAVPGGSTISSAYGTVLDAIEEAYRRDSSGLAAYEAKNLWELTDKAIEDMIDVILYEEFTSRYTPDEVLEQVSGAMIDYVGALIRPGQDPSDATFVPPEDWTDVHWDAWEALKTALDMRFIDEAQESVKTYRDTHFRQNADD